MWRSDDGNPTSDLQTKSKVAGQTILSGKRNLVREAPQKQVEQFIWALPVLSACQNGLGHLIRAELSKFKNKVPLSARLSR